LVTASTQTTQATTLVDESREIERTARQPITSSKMEAGNTVWLSRFLAGLAIMILVILGGWYYRMKKCGNIKRDSSK
jgi:hypothetical protein